MGKREFYHWVRQVHDETAPVEKRPDSWAGYDEDDWYQQARQRREAARGR